MKNFDLIKRFLDQEMTEAEALAFQQRLAAEEDLALELKVQQLEELAIDQMAQENTLRIIREERRGKKPAPVRRLWPWVAAAAAVTLLLIGVFFLAEPPAPSIAQAARSEYQQNPMSISHLRTGDSSLDRERQKHWQTLETQNEAEAADAVAFFSQAPTPADTLARQQYYLAHAYMLQQQYPKATASFEAFLQTPQADTRLRPFARYYLLLTYLAQEDIPAAKKVLQRIRENKDDNFAKEVDEWEKQL